MKDSFCIIFHKLADSQVEAFQVEHPSAYASLVVVLQTQVAAADTHHTQGASVQEILVVLVEQSQEVGHQQDPRTQLDLAEVSKVDLMEVEGVVLSASVVEAVLHHHQNQAAWHSALHSPSEVVRQVLELGRVVG